MRVVVIIALMSSLLGAAHVYLHHRLLVSPAWGGGDDRMGAVVLAVLAVMLPAGIVAGRTFHRAVGRPLATLSYVWLGTLLLLFTATVVGEPIRLIARLVAPDSEPHVSRWIAGVTLLWGVGGTLAGSWSALSEVKGERVEVTLPRLPASLSGFRLVQLSDLHIGPLLGRAWLQRIVARVNELEADAVANTGDLVDGSVHRLRHHVAPLAELCASHGVYFVTGNHEYYSGASAWCAHLGELGFRVLRNERVAIDGDDGAGFDLAGVDDWHAFGRDHGRDLAGALDGRDRARAVVLLAHQPCQVLEAAEQGVDLQLSGHTHGGQIFPWRYAVRLQQPYLAGLVRRGDTQLYVSRGTGFWGPPMRVFAAPEITLLELRAE